MTSREVPWRLEITPGLTSGAESIIPTTTISYTVWDLGFKQHEFHMQIADLPGYPPAEELAHKVVFGLRAGLERGALDPYDPERLIEVARTLYYGHLLYPNRTPRS